MNHLNALFSSVKSFSSFSPGFSSASLQEPSELSQVSEQLLKSYLLSISPLSLSGEEREKPRSPLYDRERSVDTARISKNRHIKHACTCQKKLSYLVVLPYQHRRQYIYLSMSLYLYVNIFLSLSKYIYL